MAKTKLSILRSIGRQDVKKFGVPPLQEGDVYEATAKEADVLLNKMKVAQPYDPETAKRKVQAVPVATAVRNVPARPAVQTGVAPQRQSDQDEGNDESPVADENAPDAIDRISRMRSKDRLQEIADTDPRVSVQEAAKKRLEEMYQ